MMALEGIRVLDLSRLAPGPFCTMLLGDLGADVIVVEAPPERLRGGLRAEQVVDAEAFDRARAYNPLGRNKRSIVLDLQQEEARRVFFRLAETADVVLEGFRPGVVKRLGVDYEAVSAVNPRIVYCSLSGYGQDGPYAGMVGHDINYISIGGALGMIGWPGQPPAIPLNVIADFAAGGLHAAYAILAALLARERTGRGQYVDIAMSDGVLYLLALFVGQNLASGESSLRGEALLNGGAPCYNVYQTKDGGWISVGSLEPQFFANLCRVLGCEELVPFQHEPSRREEIFRRFRERFLSKTRDEWFALLRETDACAAPVYSLGEALADAHNRQREMVVEVEHPTLGKVRQVGVGTKLSETPGEVRSLTPQPGQHTDEVLAEVGLSAGEIAALRSGGAIA
ncbi:MAG: CaiB/BaiF CoA-transferase family protein [Dehalococcoidia bacterium]|jgi:crotonobetainyl-CoA:carnitine CoA-transferase CaiB-like acyl-CoA transferase